MVNVTKENFIEVSPSILLFSEGIELLRKEDPHTLFMLDSKVTT